MTIGIALPGKIVADWALDLSGVLHPSNKIMRITLIEGKKKSDALLMTAGDSQLTYRFEMAIRAGNLAPEADELNNDDELSFEAALVTHRSVTYYDALAAVAECSRMGNEQHNPGQPLHWDRSKSQDEADALVRHLIERGTVDTDGIRHSAKLAWRALALLQKEIEAGQAAAAAREAVKPRVLGRAV